MATRGAISPGWTNNWRWTTAGGARQATRRMQGDKLDDASPWQIGRNETCHALVPRAALSCKNPQREWTSLRILHSAKQSHWSYNEMKGQINADPTEAHLHNSRSLYSAIVSEPDSQSMYFRIATPAVTSGALVAYTGFTKTFATSAFFLKGESYFGVFF